MNLTVSPSGPLLGEINLPGDKSLSHRAALFAALAEGASRFENFLLAGVTRAMLNALSELGVSWKLEGEVLFVEGCGIQGFRPSKRPIDCGSSATTLRLLAGALAASGAPAVLDGSDGLRRRPMDRIVSPLASMGVPIRASASGTAPLYLSERPSEKPLRGISYQLPVASAQVKSCLLLAGLAAGSPISLSEPGPSRDHTERLLKAMGVSIRKDTVPEGLPHGSALTLVPPVQPLSPLMMSLPGDFSSAAFLIIAALITPRSALVVKEVGLNPSRTGLIDALKSMGAVIEVELLGERCGEPYGNIFVQHSSLSATSVSGPLVVRMIDEFPAFAVAAAFASGTTLVSEASELRHKESDRIARLCKELSHLGVEAVEMPDGFSIRGGQGIHSGSISHHGDHRLAMSLAAAGLASDGPVTVVGQEIISESYPNFATDLRSLGANIEMR
jgi:3-phosphoshikimate 1-carboxyvinyltransferase